MNDSKKLKVVTVVGTRPEIIRLARILPKMDENFDHKIVFTKQSYDYELSDIFFQEFELRQPDYILNVKAQTLGAQIGNIISQTEKVLIDEKADALLVLGDTNSTLCTVIAKRLKIPIFHMEAGNRSFDWDVPEEVNRRIVDHISDFNLTYTAHARQYLIQEGIDPSKIFITGSPLTEVFSHFAIKIDSSKILEELNVEQRKYLLVSTHREENVDNTNVLEELFLTFEHLAEVLKLPIIVSLHPRTKKRIEENKISINPLIKLHKPFGYLDFCKLQKNAYCVLSDSGTIQEESVILQFPAIQIRKSTERPEAFDAGSIILSGFNKNVVENAVTLTVKEFNEQNGVSISEFYKDKNVSGKVVKLIMGFAGIKKYHGK